MVWIYSDLLTPQFLKLDLDSFHPTSGNKIYKEKNKKGEILRIFKRRFTDIKKNRDIFV